MMQKAEGRTQNQSSTRHHADPLLVSSVCCRELAALAYQLKLVCEDISPDHISSQQRALEVKIQSNTKKGTKVKRKYFSVK